MIRCARSGHCGNTLYKSRRCVQKTLFKSDYMKTLAGLEQFARAQQKVGSGRSAHRFIALGKSLVQEDAVGRHTFQQDWHQRTPQVVGDNHCIEPARSTVDGQGPGSVLQICME